MKRRHFLNIIATAGAMHTLSDLKGFTASLSRQNATMPVLFVGHGSPTNGIEDNEFTRRWKQMAQSIPVPEAVLVISAHWLTKGTAVTAMEHPRTIHDFGGFSKELYEVEYPAPGSTSWAQETASLIRQTSVALDHDWGLDHGAWSVVKQMYPEAKIPVLQLSIDYQQPAQYHYDLGKELAALRKRGVLILASGNMVHNLGRIRLPSGGFSAINEPYGFDWAIEMNELFKKHIRSGNHDALIRYDRLGAAAKLAVPTPDHYYPLMYVLGLQARTDEPEIFNDQLIAGSLSMTSVKWSAG